MEGFFSFSESVIVEQTFDKSVFTAVACPAESVREVEENMRQVRGDYPKARHYVYAYRLWTTRGEKASDDGEPQGTGGRPVLEALVHRRIWNAHMIVVRYFGGILLGTGGLSRAYGGTARLALERANVYQMAEHWRVSLRISYSFYDEFRYGCARRGWRIETEEYREYVYVSLTVPVEEEGQYVSWMTEAGHGRVTCLDKECVWRKLGH
ncbi:MAG: YigZ family protein [Peptococcaceae bacterium]|nr:YigZ family protein [Peptococcaceae bacterium]